VADDNPRDYEAHAGDANLPIPDPTRLTTQLVDRAIAAFREVMETRLGAMDKAIILGAERVERIPPSMEAARTRIRADVDDEIHALRELLETRLGAMDKATELLAATVGRVPSEVDKSVGALRELLGARIDGMDIATKLLADTVSKFPSDVDRAVTNAVAVMQAELRNVQDVSLEKFAAIDGTFASNALALTAALAAQKEAAAEQNKSNTLAITKSEQATKETILANAAQNTATAVAASNTLADLKDRVVRLESGGVASAHALSESRLDRGESVSAAEARAIAARANISIAIAIIVAVVSVVTVIVVAFHK
jgi:hypothetical protein